ncbi:MAG TPA: GNAT family N-acetyltransferase [Candidatus Acidoferrum sp.]|nr:GNAT family N-acetyltransferase [Candidatus Acidoferrum sp.]
MAQNPEPTQPALNLRRLTRADLPFVDSLRAMAGWNQTLADWERFLATEPDGCFLAEWNGTRAGTATTTIFPPDLAWIGMVLVHPDFRRRGIGRALLEHSITYLRNRGVRCIKLDATPAGKPVYDGLGFRSEWTLKRWVGRPAAVKPTARPSGLRHWQATDAGSSEPLDVAAFGMSRRALLVALAAQSSVALVLEIKTGSIAGFGFARAGSQALYLGPVVADSAKAGVVLIEALIAHNPGEVVYWDIPDPNGAAVSLAQRYGFNVQRPLLRMFLGKNVSPGDPRRQFALAGPEVG